MRHGLILLVLAAVSFSAVAQVSVEEAKARLDQRAREASTRPSETVARLQAELDKSKAEAAQLRIENDILREKATKLEKIISASTEPPAPTPTELKIGMAEKDAAAFIKKKYPDAVGKVLIEDANGKTVEWTYWPSFTAEQAPRMARAAFNPRTVYRITYDAEGKVSLIAHP